MRCYMMLTWPTHGPPHMMRHQISFNFYNDTYLNIDPSAYVDPDATVRGKVALAADTSVWPRAVLRGDINEIRIGRGSNIQDLCCLHVADYFPCVVGEDCDIGHGVKLHGCQIGNGVLVGIGAIVLNGAVIGDGCVIAAGALVPEGMIVPPNSLVMGIPGKIKRETTVAERDSTLHFARKYVQMAQRYRCAEINPARP